MAVVSPKIPPAGWRRLARRYGKKIVHLPLKRFGGQLLERLRTFHVLNGKQVRSYAADYIRDSVTQGGPMPFALFLFCCLAGVSARD